MTALRASYGVGRYVASEADYTIGTTAAWAGDRPRLVYCHGATGTAAEVLTHPEQVALIRALAQDYLVTVADLGYDTYGSELAVTRAGQVLDYQAAAYGATGPAVFVGVSMGMLTSAVTALNRTDVAAVVGIIPALDLADVYAQNPSLQAGINAAYGGAYNDGTHGPTHSPVQFAGSLSRNIPIGLFYASDDTMARPSTVTAFVNARRVSTQLATVGALGHTNAAIAAAQAGVLEFLAGI